LVGLAIALRGIGFCKHLMSETRFIAEDFVETFADVVRD